ncbi:MAG: DUF3429 family protein [Gammaproteobacteria bacterium]
MNAPATDHLDALKADAASADVVVFASRISDVRDIVARMEDLEIPHRLVIMAMGEADQRHRFHVLEEWTGWRTLPQVFVNGQFIGGPRELLRHRRLQGHAPGAGAWLGYLGLVPFALALAGMLFGEPGAREYFARQFLAYGAVILSFVGAVHWGVALSGARRRPAARMLVSVLPALVAWAALLLPPAPAAWLLLAGFVGVRIWELTERGRSGLPDWYLKLRSRLTGAVALFLVVFAVAAP